MGRPFQVPVKTSRLSKSLLPLAPRPAKPEPTHANAAASSPPSPAFSSASTASGSDLRYSPELPPLPPPKLPQRAQDFLRTPFGSDDDDDDDDQNFDNDQVDDRGYVTASWGSPYPPTTAATHLRRLSSSSEEDSPIHRLEIRTPFLRPPPDFAEDHDDHGDGDGNVDDHDNHDSFGDHFALDSDSDLRCPVDGLQRIHRPNWLQDRASGSASSRSSSPQDTIVWSGEREQTPKAVSRRLFPPRDRSEERPLLSRSNSTETLKARNAKDPDKNPEPAVTMASAHDDLLPTPTTPRRNSVLSFLGFGAPPARPKPAPKENLNPHPDPSVTNTGTLRPKKKIPWKGKNIMVLLPRDDERGQPGKAPRPLNEAETQRMFQSWEELGYPVGGFDLDGQGLDLADNDNSESRSAWPSFSHIARERAEHKYKVALPDLNAWNRYEDELREAKLRALGVTLGDDDPVPSSSSFATNPSRQPSNNQYPGLPFSPPVPTSSASSNPGYPFPAAFSSTGQSPNIPAMASPVSFNGPPYGHHGKFNPRQSISIPSARSPFQIPSPHGWTSGPIGHSRGSPSLMNLNGMRSPNSPFQLDGHPPSSSPAFGLHSRHQSMQFPMISLSHQPPVNRSQSWLQEVREVDEEAISKTPSRTPEPARRNSDTLQAEIDDAEYHLEEQLRNQLEHEDYSPHQKENGHSEMPRPQQPPTSFAPEPARFPTSERFANNPGQPLVLHHPRPHSRGHSLTQNFFREHGENDANKYAPVAESETQKVDETYEVETNPSNLGTPVQPYDYAPTFQPPHARNFSTTGNPWNDAIAMNGGRSTISRGHPSKPSLSTLNVQAPEFKFNPNTSFQPGKFVFGNNNSFKPNAFQPTSAPAPPPIPQHAPKASFSFSKINAAAPAFAPGNNESSFSTSGPKFRPNAPSFTPLHSGTNSVSFNSPVSGAENRSSLVFGGNDRDSADFGSAKKYNAVPIVQPSSSSSNGDGVEDEPKENESRAKRPRGSTTEDEAETRFALPSDSAGATPVQASSVVEAQPVEAQPGPRSADEATPAEASILSSTVASDPTDSKPSAESPSVTSLEQSAVNWAPFKFENADDMTSFDVVRPFGLDRMFQNPQNTHEMPLSATPKDFTPTPRAEPYENTGEDTQLVSDAASGQTVPLEERLPVSMFARSPSPSPIPAPNQPVASRLSWPPPKPRGLAESRSANPPQSPDHGNEKVEIEYIMPDANFEEESSEKDVWRRRPYQGEEGRSPITQEIEAVMQHLDEDMHQAPGHDNKLPSFDEIDAVMEHINRHDPDHGIKKSVDPVLAPQDDESPRWHQPSPTRRIAVPELNDSSFNMPLPEPFMPGGRRLHKYHVLASPRMLSANLEDPFVDPPHSVRSFAPSLNRPDADATSVPGSDWDRDFSDDYQDKLENRAHFFDGRVNELVGGLLAGRLDPLEKTLQGIQQAISDISKSANPSRRGTSVDLQESDADDEGDDAPHRSQSPHKSRRMEQIRNAVLEALATQPTQPSSHTQQADGSAVLQALVEMKEQLGTSLRLGFRGEDLKNMVEEAVENRLPLSPKPAADEDAPNKLDEMQARIMDLEERLFALRKATGTEADGRRVAQDSAADLGRKLQAAETRVEIEIMNRSICHQRVADLEERIKQHDKRADEETKSRRAVEDRLSEVQRLLRIASEEEDRLRAVVEERNERIRSMESAAGDMAIEIQLLEARHLTCTQTQTELANLTNSAGTELKQARTAISQLQPELDRVREVARRNGMELSHVLNENRHLQKVLDTLGVQLQETERIREAWRAKYGTLQEELVGAHRAIAEESAGRARKDETMRLRQDALEARLQAESKTRERLEKEMERLEGQERDSIRAVKEAKRLEELLGELRTENHHLRQTAMKSQVDFQEARTTAALEVERIKRSMQIELDESNAQVNMVRDELEFQMGHSRNEIDSVKLAADTAKAQHEMLLEEAQTTSNQKIADLEASMAEATAKYQGEIEDLHTQYRHKLGMAEEEMEKNEQRLLDRLSLSTSKSEHLQDRLHHIEEKLEIAKEAAQAAVLRAKSTSVEPKSGSTTAPRTVVGLPEKISPQALRESIMVLQEQLQQREHTIEEYEQKLASVDPDAESKITKRDDEIMWLRELLAVRHGDLQDIIGALSAHDIDRESVREAAIRLKANLQMEEQERDRAMNGGSAITLPNIAQTIRDAATPRASELGTRVAAAWGSWRKGGSGLSSHTAPASATISSVQSTPAKPSKATSQGFLSGLLTPPASGVRPMSASASAVPPQPTAFANTGRRLTSQRVSSGMSSSSNTSSLALMAAGLLDPMATPSPIEEPTSPAPMNGREFVRTPPIIQSNDYDSDAQAGDFDDRDFFEEDD